MKRKISFICEICGREYMDEYDAVACEAKGIPSKDRLPVGLMYPYYHNGFVGIFAIAKVEIDRHYIRITSYAARVEGYPPGVGINGTLGDKCGSFNAETEAGFYKNNRMKPQHFLTREYKLMWAALKINGITPTYIDENGILKNANI